MESSESDYDPLAASLSYKTMWTNGLFEDSRAMLKISRLGTINIRIPWSSIIWGVAFFIVAALIFVGGSLLLNLGALFIPIALAISAGFGFLGAKLGRWSPMQKTTGEDLITYLKFTLRNKIASGGFGKGKISTTQLLSRAEGGEEGRIVECTQWLGTQPLRNAPPMSPYHREYKSVYELAPSGEYSVVDSGMYHDGLGDRGI